MNTRTNKIRITTTNKRTNELHREHQVQIPNTSTDREPRDSIRKGDSTSKGTTVDNGIAQNTGHHRRPQGTTGDQGEHTHVKRMINDKTVFSQ